MDDQQKSRPAGTGTASKDSLPEHSNTAIAQRQRLLDALSRQSVSTLEARRDLDILSPANRVKELRAQGFDIVTVMVYEPTECGKIHRVGRYVMVGGGVK